MSLLGKNISANIFSSAWLTVLMLLLTPVYIRFLGVESYGLIGFYFSWVAILGILDTAVSATISREIAWLTARSNEGQKIPTLLFSLETIYWGIILVLGLAFFVGAWFFGADWFQVKNLSSQIVREALMLMAFSLVAQVPSGIYIAGLMGLQRQVECSSLLALFGTLRGVGAVMVLWMVAHDVRLFFLWQILVSALQTGVMRWQLWKKVRIDQCPPRFSAEMLRSVGSFAGGMGLITAISIVITQMDKMILSRAVPLEAFGFYMLAWTVGSGLLRMGLPIISAFGPRFTELVSKGDDKTLAQQVHLSSQLLNVLILSPTLLIMFLSKPILLAWTGNSILAAGVAPILTVMVIGTVLSCCSYPALSLLYSRKQLKPVIITTLVSFIVLSLLLVMAIRFLGVMGAAFCWALYGLTLYIVFQIYGLKELPQTGFFLSLWRDFIVPGIMAFVVAVMAGYFLNHVEKTFTFFVLLGFWLMVGWFASLFVCKDLFKLFIRKLEWKFKITSLSV